MIDQVIGKESRPLPLGLSALDQRQYAAVAAKRVGGERILSRYSLAR